MPRSRTVVPVPLSPSAPIKAGFRTPPRKLHTNFRCSDSKPRLARSASAARLYSSSASRINDAQHEADEYLDLDLDPEDEDRKHQTRKLVSNRRRRLPALRKCHSDGVYGHSPSVSKPRRGRDHQINQGEGGGADNEDASSLPSANSEASSAQSSTSRRRRKSHHRKITKRFTIKELRAYLADVSPTDDALLKACLKGDTGTVVALVSQGGVPLETTRDARGATPMIVAAERGHVETVLALYGLGAKVDAVDDFGSSPLCSAASVGRLEMCKTLLKIGADPHNHNKEGVCALILAARQLAETHGKEPKYTQCAELCRELCLHSKSNYEPSKEEIGDAASWRMVREWMRAKTKCQELYIPPAKVFLKGSSAVRKFFREEHDRTDVWEVLKVVMVVAFVIFDFASRDMVFTPSVVALYLFLYVCAYAL